MLQLSTRADITIVGVNEVSISDNLMDESPASAHSQSQFPESSSSPFSESKEPNRTPAPPSSVTRLWRPAAQRNLRNQWSNLANHRQKWTSFSSTALSNANSLANSFLSQKYMKHIELGVLSDMPDIRTKACRKLFKQQELHRSKLLSNYKNMVAVVKQMVVSVASMRCYSGGSSSGSLLQFSSSSKNGYDDDGDCGGIPVFTFWSIFSFEKLAQELIRMFELELILKRLLVIELLSINNEEVEEINGSCWSYELYPGEFDDLIKCNLYSIEACEPILPVLDGCNSEPLLMKLKHQPESDVLQVYLTTWLAQVNIDKHRVDEIFAVVGEEMKVLIS